MLTNVSNVNNVMENSIYYYLFTYYLFRSKEKKKLERYNIKFIHLNFSYSIIIHLLLFLLITYR